MLMGSAAALGKQAPLSPHVRGPICDTPTFATSTASHQFFGRLVYRQHWWGQGHANESDDDDGAAWLELTIHHIGYNG